VATTTTAHVSGGIGIGGSAVVTFTHGTGQAPSNVVLEVDLDNDGDFDETEENLLSFGDDVLQGLESVTGRDLSRPDSHAEAGRLRATLLNEDDLFSRFNTASPLNQDPYSLKPGRKVRIRTTESTPDDPVLLARDRFARPDGDLGIAETGQAWTNQLGEFTIVNGLAEAGALFFSDITSTIDVGQTSYYVQATLRRFAPDATLRYLGLMIHWTDANNNIAVFYSVDTRTVIISQFNAGVATQLDESDPFAPWEGMPIGVGVVGTTVTAYIGGSPVASGTSTVTTTGKVGLYCQYTDFDGAAPQLGDFHVWDHVRGEVEGILWTGDLDVVGPSSAPGSVKLATLDADGPLAAAARADIASPRLPLGGAPTGLIVGDVLRRAGLLHPPAPIANGTITPGPVGIADGDAQTLARVFEETERGLVHETHEGGIGFQDAAHRATASPEAWFSDSNVGQFLTQGIELRDQRARVVNQVTAGVAPDSPSGITITTVSGSGDVNIVLPTVNDGDLLAIFIASTANTAGERWLTPIFWVSHRDAGTALGLRAYSHWCNGTEGGTTVIFYANSGVAPGLFVAVIVRVEGWFLSPAGIAMSDVANGHDPGALVHGWGREPTLYVIIGSAIAAVNAISFSDDFIPPEGYSQASGLNTSSGTPGTEAGIMYATKIDCTESENPSLFVGLVGGFLNESLVFAVRGYNGPHTKATLEDPNTSGGDGRFVTVDDLASQDEHRAILPYPSPSLLLATEADAAAYGEAILAAQADDRPLVSMTFIASLSSSYRNQAIRRRVGDMIWLTADGPSGHGIDAAFFIEQIDHAWTNNGTLWEVTWLLSPA